MATFANFGDFVKSRWKTQVAAAKALKTRQNVVSNWVTGRNAPSDEMQAVLRDKWGYDGTWPKEDAKAPAGGPYLTEKDFAEWRGYWRAGTEQVLQRLEKAEQEIAALKDQIRKLNPPAAR